jgi:hypothetical protein
MFFSEKNSTIKQKKPQIFTKWVTENHASITSQLIEFGLSFLIEHTKKPKSPITHLILDNRWHYLDKAKKESYRGVLSNTPQGVPHLTLTYYTFRNGGVSVAFNSKDALKALWMHAVDHAPLPVIHQAIQPALTAPIKPTSTIDYLARDAAIWKTLSPNGTSHYLNRKGFSGQTIPGIRFGKERICIKIINQEGVYQGLQTILNTGDKRFTKGLAKKGHFALIGLDDVPVKLKAINLCEGVATATSIFMATNEPVFAALDAFNLLPVAKNLKKRFPKTQIIFWADNDRQKADKILPNGRKLGNTGLIHANRAAFKLRDALVCTPDFSLVSDVPNTPIHQALFSLLETLQTNGSLFLHTSSLYPKMLFLILAAFNQEITHHQLKKAQATDFNDLMQLSGLAAIHDTIPKRPDIALALTHELHQYQTYHHGVISHKQFQFGQRESYHTRYLPTVDFDSGVHLIKSPIGSGKTAMVEALVKANPKQSVLFTTHLISLVESAAARLDLCSYNECDRYDLKMESRLAICLNSLGKLTTQGALNPYDIVIIDEIEQVLARLTTNIDQKPLVFSVLMHVMTQAKTLICLDAHLSRTTIQLIQSICNDKPVTIHLNTHVQPDERHIIFHDNAESVQLEAMRTLNNNQTAFLTFNSKAEAFKTFSAIQSALPEKKGLYIASDNAGDAANQAFFKDVNGESVQYDYLICTPSVSTGVSIDNNHFDFVGGIFLCSVNTANDCMQALGRVRNKTVRHVFCEKRYGHHSLNADVIASRWLATHQHDLNLMNLTNEGASVIMNAEYESLCLSVTLSRHRSLNDFYQEFCLLSLNEGITLSYAEHAPDNDTKKQFRQFKQIFADAESHAVGLADVPESAQALREMLNIPRKTFEQSRSLKKQQTIEFFHLAPDDTQSIQALASLDNDNQFKKQVLNLELALGDKDLAQKQFLKQTEKNPQFAADVKHFAVLQLLFKQLLVTLHLLSDNHCLNSADYRYTREMVLNSGFIDFIENHRTIFQGILSLPSTHQLNKDPIRFISTLLKRVGLKQKRVGRAEHATYHVDGDRIALLNGILTKRQAGLMGASIPLNTQSVPVKALLSWDAITACLQGVKRFFGLNVSPPVFA